jgi:3D (Asp-Asp-Asp) domain-containing protein/predicted  nucleic acid-binding Zn-ribbon protein
MTAFAVFLILALVPGGLLAQPAATDRDTLVRDVVAADHEIEAVSARLTGLSQQSAELRERLSTTQAEVAANRKRLTAKREALTQRVRRIYVNGKASNIEVLFSSADFSDFMERADMMKKVTSQDARLIAGVRSESRRLAESVSELQSRKAEVDGLRRELASRKSQLEQARAQKQALIAKAGEARPAVVSQSQQIESKIRQLNPSSPVTPPNGKHSGRYVTMVATAYCPLEPGLSYGTATGMRAQHGVVAVDPRFMPLGTRVYIEGYGYAVAGDTGSAIKGNRIDLCFDTLEECYVFGWRVITVEILD